MIGSIIESKNQDNQYHFIRKLANFTTKSISRGNLKKDQWTGSKLVRLTLLETAACERPRLARLSCGEGIQFPPTWRRLV